MVHLHLYSFILFSCFTAAIFCVNVETIEHCCTLGSNYAKSNLECSKFPTPIKGIDKLNETECLKSIEKCCENQKRETECDLGKSNAKEGQSCKADNDVIVGCCEACISGISRAKLNQLCDQISLGQPNNKIAIACCKEEYAKKRQNQNYQITGAIPVEDNTHSELLPAIPPLENLCDISEICAQICVPTENSYKCACNKGFLLMADGVSCKPDSKLNKTLDRCNTSNPCQHTCEDTGVAIKCSCREGYELQTDKKTCKDIDECALGTHDCEPTDECVNEDGTYYCYYDETPSCPEGFKFNSQNSTCDDINECEFSLMCPRPKKCINLVGSFQCIEEEVPQCPPGFYFKDAIGTCTDIDECITGNNNCNKESQTCLNTKGNYTCIDKVSKKTCPPGFKKNLVLLICEDINECEENEQPCDATKTCVNEPGGHSCVSKYDDATTIISPILTKATTPTYLASSRKPESATCPKGYVFSKDRQTCIDFNECETDNPCDSYQLCYNKQGGYECKCKVGFTTDNVTGACVDINECQIGIHECTVNQRCDNTLGSYYCARITGCGTGYTLNSANGLCEDDDECSLKTDKCFQLGSNFECRNTLGSYRCEQIRSSSNSITYPTTTKRYPVWSYPHTTFPPISQWTCPKGFRIDNIGQCTRIYTTPRLKTYKTSSFPELTVTRKACPQGHYINHDGECISFTTGYYVSAISTTSRVTISGEKKRCLPGYKQNYRGECEDIDECSTNPCKKGETCYNLNGRHQCIPKMQCKIGYELNEEGDACIDVNECVRGKHFCNPTQICKNGEGYYTCECPLGHHINPLTRNCEDIDECKYYRMCPSNSICVNTIGSYECKCKTGFTQSLNSCIDIDECIHGGNGFCEHICVNLWGSYRCACREGFTLDTDNRTCLDVDECQRFKDKKLCVGSCLNIPGSYKCACPKGYKLGSDHRTCQDIDECEKNICPNYDDICVNTRGGYKCHAINCPPNYLRDLQHKSRCKRTFCDSRDHQCLLMPEQYTYHFIAIVSNLPIVEGQIQFFQINGPVLIQATAEFTFKVVNVNCPYGIERINENYFKKETPFGRNTMQLYLVRSIQGPQEAELEVAMKLYHNRQIIVNVVSKIFFTVSAYPF